MGNLALILHDVRLLGILKYPVTRSRVLAKKQVLIHEPSHKTIKINDWLPPKAYFDCEQPEIDWLLSLPT